MVEFGVNWFGGLVCLVVDFVGVGVFEWEVVLVVVFVVGGLCLYWVE